MKAVCCFNIGYDVLSEQLSRYFFFPIAPIAAGTAYLIAAGITTDLTTDLNLNLRQPATEIWNEH